MYCCLPLSKVQFACCEAQPVKPLISFCEAALGLASLTFWSVQDFVWLWVFRQVACFVWLLFLWVLIYLCLISVFKEQPGNTGKILFFFARIFYFLKSLGDSVEDFCFEVKPNMANLTKLLSWWLLWLCTQKTPIALSSWTDPYSSLHLLTVLHMNMKAYLSFSIFITFLLTGNSCRASEAD